MIQQIKLLKECFPKTYIRKIFFLIFYSNRLFYSNDGNIIGMIYVFRDEITLLCVGKKSRNLGIATYLIKNVSAYMVKTYKINKSAINLYIKNDFIIFDESKKKIYLYNLSKIPSSGGEL